MGAPGDLSSSSVCTKIPELGTATLKGRRGHVTFTVSSKKCLLNAMPGSTNAVGPIVLRNQFLEKRVGVFVYLHIRDGMQYILSLYNAS
mmetsp:Transcript_46473/g.72748  ORF Transcript_46473/g.72748 Transcript_46473/m.72748 type:complete len:89 (-) Transcript_46473:195-461(-)